MSEKRFDPEKVERLSQIDVERQTPVGELYETRYVRCEDYDQLLALYRELRRQFNTGMNDSRAASRAQL